MEVHPMSNRFNRLRASLAARVPIIDNLDIVFTNKARISLWVCVGVTIFTISGMSLYSYFFLRLDQWQFLALAGLMLFLGIASIVGISLARRGSYSKGIWLMLVTGQIIVAISPLFIGGQGLWYAAGVILSTLLISTLTLDSSGSTRAIIIGVLAALSALVIDQFVTLYQVITPVLLSYLVIGVVIFLLVAYLFTLSFLFNTYSLRGKLTFAVFSAALISIIVLGVIYNRTNRVTLSELTNQTLQLAAERTAADVDAYLVSLVKALESINLEPSPISYYLSLPPESRDHATGSLLKYYREELGALELVLLDRQGNVVLHTTYGDVSDLESYMGLSEDDQNLIKTSILGGGSYFSSVLFPTARQLIYINKPYFYVGEPIADSSGSPIGIMLAAYPVAPIQQIVQNSNGLIGDQSFAVLLDDNYMRIAQGMDPEANFTLVSPLDNEKFSRLQEEQRLPPQRSDLITTNIPEFKAGLDRLFRTPFFETREIGIDEGVNLAAGVRLTQKGWILAYMQPRSVVLQPIEQQARTTVLVTGLIGGLAILASSLLAQVITNPIVQLTKAAERASGGDLSLRAPVTSSDEVGKLGVAFNSMIDQLRTTLQGLEERVRERTAELSRTSEQLEYRASRLQMVAEVAHTFSAVTDPEELLSVVAKTISESFGFYHVGVFIVDKFGEYAVLMASNSEGGRRMLGRGHRLRVGEEGLVGYVTSYGEARIALDVGVDAVYFNNPDLPETRSEITLPLKTGGKVFGALDVQSTMPKAFDASDIALLSTLADQVAMAIENVRLINDAQRNVRELELAQRQYVQQEWGKVVNERPRDGYNYHLGKLIPLKESEAEETIDFLPETPTVVFEQVSGNGNQQPSGLVVPIIVRGQPIGLIELNEPDTQRQWGEEEISLANSVADQVGQALENARLLEATQRRAERERLVSEITTKLRASNDPQEILETAVTQLKHALRVRSVQVRVVHDEMNDTFVHQHE
jgi:GAF domain-containing protein/HAMP domain-containing protein